MCLVRFSIIVGLLSADDNGATRFCRYVIAALKTVYPATDTAIARALVSTVSSFKNHVNNLYSEWRPDWHPGARPRVR
jgi:hypothetical protein